MTVPVALPSYVGVGQVLGTSIVVGVDTAAADADNLPDAVYPQGSEFTFTPTVDYLVFPGARTTIYLSAVAAVIDANGNPTTPDGSPLYVVANVGQVGNDQAWYWKVKPKIGGKFYAEFTLDVTAGGVAYLTDSQPIPATTTSSAVVRGPAGQDGRGLIIQVVTAANAATTPRPTDDPTVVVWWIGSDSAHPPLAALQTEQVTDVWTRAA